MTIYSGDIKLLASAVMLDVPEGGGGPTANVIPDGVSNAVYPDISEMDRTNGRVNVRQLHLAVVTDTTDTYLGANVVVADPPADPNVSITLFSTGDPFDTRAEAVSRMEAYLSIGATYQGHLFGNHIAGQSTLLILQRSDTPLAVGETLVLTKREGFADQYQQYVRVTDSSVVSATFTDERGDFTRNVMTVKLSDVLRQDFLGFDASRTEISSTTVAQRTKISGTVVANAARYYGVVPLVQDASMGEFTIRAASMFTQLVPSAQIETPLVDVRTNQAPVALVSAGAPVTHTIWGPLYSTVLAIGQSVVPTTLTAGVAVYGYVTESGDGILRTSSGEAFARIDYESGLMTTEPGKNFVNGMAEVTYSPAAAATVINQSQGFEVTQANRALNYVRTIEPPPVKGTLSVSFRAQDKWYVLRDDGTGALRGSDSSIGAGTVNFTTGTVMTTFGAMPDVDTMVIYQWVQPDSERKASEISVGVRDFYIAINADGDLTEAKASKAFQPGSVAISWNDGSARTVTDNALGGLLGYATGTVDYANGVARMRPTTLPPVGTSLTLGRTTTNVTVFSTPAAPVGDDVHFNIGANVPKGSVSIALGGQPKARYQGGAAFDFGNATPFSIRDTDDGRLVIVVGSPYSYGSASMNVGTINHATGDCVMTTKPVATAEVMDALARFENFYMYYGMPALGLREI